MTLLVVPKEEIGGVWDTAAPMLQRAIDLDPAEYDINHVRSTLDSGAATLLVWLEDGAITGAVTVEFIQQPSRLIAHVTLMGGKGIVRTHIFEEAQKWMRECGATVAQCWCLTGGSLSKMYEKMGMKNTHHVMRIEL